MATEPICKWVGGNRNRQTTEESDSLTSVGTFGQGQGCFCISALTVSISFLRVGVWDEAPNRTRRDF